MRAADAAALEEKRALPMPIRAGLQRWANRRLGSPSRRTSEGPGRRKRGRGMVGPHPRYTLSGSVSICRFGQYVLTTRVRIGAWR